jgi:hypothetical protein
MTTSADKAEFQFATMSAPVDSDGRSCFMTFAIPQARRPSRRNLLATYIVHER